MSTGRRAIRVWGASVTHAHGEDHWIATSEEEVYEYLFDYVENWWHDWFEDAPLPLDQREAVDRYFCAAAERDNGEYLEIFNDIIVLPWRDKAD